MLLGVCQLLHSIVVQDVADVSAGFDRWLAFL